jgi:hypothetical protein
MMELVLKMEERDHESRNAGTSRNQKMQRNSNSRSLQGRAVLLKFCFLIL